MPPIKWIWTISKLTPDHINVLVIISCLQLGGRERKTQCEKQIERLTTCSREILSMTSQKRRKKICSFSVCGEIAFVSYRQVLRKRFSENEHPWLCLQRCWNWWRAKERTQREKKRQWKTKTKPKKERKKSHVQCVTGWVQKLSNGRAVIPAFSHCCVTRWLGAMKFQWFIEHS